MKYLFTLIIGFIVVLMHAQDYEYIPFPTENAIWSEIYYPSDDENAIYERFALSGEDTTINDLLYKKLYLFYDSVFNINTATYYGGIREDSNKRIYLKSEQILHDFKPVLDLSSFSEIILYDFSLSIGDTVNTSKESNRYNWRFYDTLIISDIDTVKIGNTLRKVFYFDNYFWVSWIEGIGNTRGFLFTSSDIPNNGMYGDLICFKQNSKVLYLNGNDCMPLMTGISLNLQESIDFEVYPNPTERILNIAFSTIETGTFFVYNSVGENVFIQKISKEKNMELQLPCLNTGIYNVVFINNNRKKYRSKLIIN